LKLHQITFFLAGLTAGLIPVTFAFFGSLETTLMILANGIGPLFFVAIVAGVVITGAWRYLRTRFLRYLGGLVLCTITYLAALMAFFGVYGFSQDWFGFGRSASFEQFGIDVWLGLIAAGAVGASGIALFAALITRKWSTSLLLRLMFAGLVTIVVTFIANLPFHSYRSFFGFLLPLGNALFCCLVGTQIWQQIETARQVTATSSAA